MGPVVGLVDCLRNSPVVTDGVRPRVVVRRAGCAGFAGVPAQWARVSRRWVACWSLRLMSLVGSVHPELDGLGGVAVVEIVVEKDLDSLRHRWSLRRKVGAGRRWGMPAADHPPFAGDCHHLLMPARVR